MGVDVPDLLRLDARPRECAAHHQRHALGARLRLGQVVCVVRGAVAEELRVDLRSAPLGVVPVLEQERPGTLADHEPLAGRVERPRGVRRMLLLGRESSHRDEPGEDQRDHARFGSARDHRVDVAAADQLSGFAGGV